MFGSTVDKGAIDTVYALLQIVADPQKHKVAVDDLNTRLGECAKALSGAQEAQRDADAKMKAVAEATALLNSQRDLDRASAARASVELVTARASHETAVADYLVRKRQLDDHDAFLAKKQNDVGEYEQRVNEQITPKLEELRGREAALAKWEADVVERAAALAAKEKALADRQAELTAYLERVKSISAIAPKNFEMTAETGKLGAEMGEAR